MATVSTVVARARALLLAGTETLDASIQAELPLALLELDLLSPRYLVQDLTLSDGEVALATMTSWADVESRVVRLQYPAGELPTSYVPRVFWDVDRTEGVLRVAEITSDTIRATYTAPHSADCSSLSSRQAEAVAQLVAAGVMEAWAKRWAQNAAVHVAGEDYTGPSPAQAREAAKEARAQARRLLAAVGAVSFGWDPGLAVPGTLV